MDTPAKPSATGGGRDDCWSEAATAVLIESWGERHLRCNRGNLRQNDWNDVASTVNRHFISNGKPPRTDIQCKNRIDTIKKKYKIEKAKSSPSTWPFFNRLDFLIGPSKSSPSSGGVGGGGGIVTPNPNPKGESSDSSLDDEELLGVIGRGRKHKLDEFSGGGSGGCSKDEAYQEFARAIASLGEIYERIESSKQQLVMELEKQRMELCKELEFQRMNMIVDAQLSLEKFKRAKVVSDSTAKKS